MYKTDTLVKTLEFENGKIFAAVDGDRFLIAKADPVVEIHRFAAPLNQSNKGVIKSRCLIITIDSEAEFTRNIDSFINKISRFEIEADIFKPNGAYEVIRFNNISLKEISAFGKWTFECNDIDIIRKIITIFPSIDNDSFSC